MSTARISRRQGLQWLGAAVAGTALPSGVLKFLAL